MSWVDDALADFGRTMGLTGLSFGDRQTVSLAFEQMGTLYLERLEDEVLMYLVRRLDRPDVEFYTRALDACHWTHAHPFAPHAALKGDDALAFGIRIPDSDFQLPTIEKALEFLNSLHDRVGNG